MYGFLLKKEIYKHIWDGDLDDHLIRMRRIWGSNLVLIAFQILMRLTSIFTLH